MRIPGLGKYNFIMYPVVRQGAEPLPDESSDIIKSLRAAQISLAEGEFITLTGRPLSPYTRMRSGGNLPPASQILYPRMAEACSCRPQTLSKPAHRAAITPASPEYHSTLVEYHCKAKTAPKERFLLYPYSAVARAMAVMWGLTPSYQYRKPCTSTTSPTFRVPTVV